MILTLLQALLQRAAVAAGKKINLPKQKKQFTHTKKQLRTATVFKVKRGLGLGFPNSFTRLRIFMGVDKTAYWAVVQHDGRIECVEKPTLFQLEKYLNESGAKLLEVLRGKRVKVERVVRVELKEVEA